MPVETRLWLEWKWLIQADLDLVLVNGPRIFRVDDLVEVLLVSALAVLLGPFNGKTTVVPFPVVLNNKIYHRVVENIIIN